MIELFNGRCQMVISAFYANVDDKRTQESAKRFFDDYKKLVPVKRFIENLSLSLEVTAEDGDVEFEQMEKIEAEVARWIKNVLGVKRKPKVLGTWRKGYE